MISIQTAFLIFSFTFFAPNASHSLDSADFTDESLSSGMSEIEAEKCFHEFTEQCVESAIAHSNPHTYIALDALTQEADGYQSEALSVALGHLFYEDTADFLAYYLSQSSTDFQFHFLSELEINCEMQSEAVVTQLKSGWLARINAVEVEADSEAFDALLYQIENL